MSYNETKNPLNKTDYERNAYLKNNPTMDEDYFYAASCQDTTGLTPTVAHDEYEAESYQEVNHYLPPVSSFEAVGNAYSQGEYHLRAADGIHAEMRMEVKPQKEYHREK